MCSDAQFRMPELRARTYEEEAAESIEAAFAGGGAKPASGTGIRRGVAVRLHLFARALDGLMKLSRQGRKNRAHLREHVLSHPRRESGD